MIARAIMVGWLVLLVVLVARWWQSRDGRVRGLPRPGGGSDAGPGAGPAVASAVLVSTPTCRSCPQVRAVLADLATTVDGFRWDEVDAATDLAFVRRHDVLRAPTVLLRDHAGEVVGRAAGTIDRDALASAITRPAVGAS